jgi:hypothetical protein
MLTKDPRFDATSILDHATDGLNEQWNVSSSPPTQTAVRSDLYERHSDRGIDVVFGEPGCSAKVPPHIDDPDTTNM